MREKLRIKEFVKILSLLGKRKRGYLLAVVACAAVDPGFRIVMALVSRKMFNGIEYQNTTMLLQGFMLMAGMFLVYCIVQPVAGYHYEGRLHYPMIELRQSLLSHIVKLPLTFFDKNHSGELMSTLTNDFEEISTFYREYTYDIVTTFFLGIGSLAAMLLLDVRLSIAMITLGLVTTGLNTILSERLNILTRKIQDSIRVSNQQLVDLIEGYRVIKIYHLEERITDKYAEVSNEIGNYAKDKNTILSVKSTLSMTMSIINFIGVLSVASFMVARGMIDFGTAIAVIMLQDGVIALFADFGTYYAQFNSALGGAGRIFEILDEKEEGQDLLSC